MRSKSEQETIAAGLPGKLAAAIEKSNHIMAEDLIREAGYMLPQSDDALDFLKCLIDQEQPEGFPKEAAEILLEAFDKNKTDYIKSSPK